MSCSKFQRRLEAWAAGEVSPARAGPLAAHVARCARCRWKLAAHRRISRAIREAAAGPVPGRFDADALQRRALAARREQESVVRLLKRGAAAAAAVLLLSLALWLSVTPLAPRVGERPLAESPPPSPPAGTAAAVDQDDALATFFQDLDSPATLVVLGGY